MVPMKKRSQEDVKRKEKVRLAIFEFLLKYFIADKKIKFDTTTETLEISNEDDDLKKKKKAARRKKKDKNEDKLRFE